MNSDPFYIENIDDFLAGQSYGCDRIECENQKDVEGMVPACIACSTLDSHRSGPPKIQCDFSLTPDCADIGCAQVEEMECEPASEYQDLVNALVRGLDALTKRIGDDCCQNEDSCSDSFDCEEQQQAVVEKPIQGKPYALHRRSANTEIRSDMRAYHRPSVKSTQPPHAMNPPQHTAKIMKPIGQHCCESSKCLSSKRLSFPVVSKLFAEWDIDQIEKIKKLQVFLKTCHAPEKSLHSHVIGGKNYVLQLDVDDEVFCVCPVAFRKLIHVNADTLILATTEDSAPSVAQKAETQRETKQEQAKLWIQQFLLPECSIDETEPTKFLRCDLYANPREALSKYNDYLSKTPDSTSSVCSLSTFNRALASPELETILWGSSQHCAECVRIKQAIKVCKKSVKEMQEQRHVDKIAYQKCLLALQQLQSDFQTHEQEWKALRRYSQHYKQRAEAHPWKEVSIVFDYMAHKHLPHPPPSQRSAEYSMWRDLFGFAGMTRLFLRFAGLYQHYTNISHYYLHTHFTESTNTIVTILFLYLNEIILEQHHQVNSLVITMDNKSTGKSMLLVAFLEFIVCHLKLLQQITIVYLLKGHSVNDQDISNEPVSVIFHSSHEWQLQPHDTARLITAKAKHQIATVLSSFYDFGAALEHESIPKGLVDCQIIVTSNNHPNGAGTMLYRTVAKSNASADLRPTGARGPYLILRKVSLPPPSVQIPHLSDKNKSDLQMFLNSHQDLANEGTEYLKNVIAEKPPQEKLVFPDAILQLHEAALRGLQEEKNEVPNPADVDANVNAVPIPIVEPMLVEMQAVAPKSKLEEILRSKYSFEMGEYHFLCRFSNLQEPVWRSHSLLRDEPVLAAYKLKHSEINYEVAPVTPTKKADKKKESKKKKKASESSEPTEQQKPQARKEKRAEKTTKRKHAKEDDSYNSDMEGDELKDSTVPEDRLDPHDLRIRSGDTQIVPTKKRNNTNNNKKKKKGRDASKGH